MSIVKVDTELEPETVEKPTDTLVPASESKCEWCHQTATMSMTSSLESLCPRCRRAALEWRADEEQQKDSYLTPEQLAAFMRKR